MVKPGAVVIDVGINRVPDASQKTGYRLAGDVQFETVAPLVLEDYPGAGRRRPDDRGHADEEHRQGVSPAACTLR